MCSSFSFKNENEEHKYHKCNLENYNGNLFEEEKISKRKSLNEKKGLDLHYRVKFYGTKEWAVLQEEGLWPYSIITEEKFTKIKFAAGSKKKRLFEEAVLSIRQE